MHLLTDPDFARVVAGILCVLAIATAVGRLLRDRARTPSTRTTLDNVNARIRSWWVMSVAVLGSLLLGSTGSIVLFALLSFLALREFITLTPMRRADHRALLVAFFVVIPVQYTVVALGSYEWFVVMVPACGVLGISLVVAATGDTQQFTERVAQIYWGLMLCVYAVSHTPALLTMDVSGGASRNAKLLLFLIVVVESSDVLQYLWGKALGRRAIAPSVSPGKTVEGLIGGIASAVVVGCLLSPLTPFSPWQTALVAFLITTAGFAGGLVMSAVKREHGVKDFGTAIAGHGGILDRIDSLCFAGPVFFHLTRTFASV